MIRATTPRHVFIFDQNPDDYSKILITYSQNGSIVLEKHKDDLTIETMENPETGESKWKAWYRLTQEETKSFVSSPARQVSVQIRVLTTGGESLASEKRLLQVQDVLNDEVL